MSGGEVYPEDSVNDSAVLLAVETGIPPQVWIDEGLVAMNTAMKHLRNRIRREAAYYGQKIRDEESVADDQGRRMSG